MTNITSLLGGYSYFLISFTISLLLMIFILNGFKYSENKNIRKLQKALLYSVLFMLFIYIYYHLINLNVLFASDGIDPVKDGKLNLGLTGNLSIDKESGKAIAGGLSNIGNQIGLGAVIGSVTGSVGAVIKGS